MKYIISTILCLVIILPAIVSAYELLQPLPGEVDMYFVGEEEAFSFSDYLSWLYRFALGAVAFLAVLKIVIGGAHIVVGGDSETAQKKGRDMIEMAIWGVLLAITAWLILSVINPDLVTGKFELEPVVIEGIKKSSPAPSGSPSGLATWPPGSPPAGTYSANEARNVLAQNNPPITVNRSECVAVNQSKCTSLYGLPKSTVENLKDLAEHANESFVITGGTEYWLHSTHGPGKSIVDIRYDSSLADDISALQKEGKITSYQCESGGVKVPCGGSITPDHFHVVFSS